MIIAMFFMTGIFGYGLNTIGNIITDMNRKNNEYKM